VLSQFELGYKWKRDKTTEKVEKTAILHEDQPPQILFLERCLQFLKRGARLGIVLPESILGNPSYEYLVTYILGKMTIIGVVTMPEHLFKTSGKGGLIARFAFSFLRSAQLKRLMTSLWRMLNGVATTQEETQLSEGRVQVSTSWWMKCLMWLHVSVNCERPLLTVGIIADFFLSPIR
jgi:hypothetical protein